MPLLERSGDELRVRGDLLPFSYFPLRRGERRWGRHTMVYTSDPWAVISDSVDKATAALAQLAAGEAGLSFVEQAKEYFRAAETARSTEAQPLLFYYGFLNLAKALAIARGQQGLVGKVRHGVGVADLSAGVMSAELEVYPTKRNATPSINAYDELLVALTGGSGVGTKTKYPLADLLSQILFGHRLWVEATRRKERFVGLERVELQHVKKANSIWINLVVPESSLVWRGLAKRTVVEKANLRPDFDFVRGVKEADGQVLRIFQQVTPTTYGARPSDDLMNLIDTTKPRLWRAITSTEPYRRYYVYLSEPGEVRLPQLMSVYLVMFYLGSLTRYNPSMFHDLLESGLGPFLREFLSSEPHQFLYGIACEFAKREVSRAAVV